jgi:hypothetical protein
VNGPQLDLEQAAETVASPHADGVYARTCGQRSQGCGLVERSTWPMLVVALFEPTQDPGRGSLVDDQWWQWGW